MIQEKMQLVPPYPDPWWREEEKQKINVASGEDVVVKEPETEEQ